MRGFAMSWLLLCAGCTGWQSALAPKGPQAAQLSWLLWSFIVVCGVIWLLVMLVLAGSRCGAGRRAGWTAAGRTARSRSSCGLSVAATVLVIIVLTRHELRRDARHCRPPLATRW